MRGRRKFRADNALDYDDLRRYFGGVLAADVRLGEA